jgi:chromosome segregation ATPase
MKKVFILPVIILAFASCNTKQLESENAALKAAMDSLNIQIANDKVVGEQLAKVSALMDSIDKERNALRINLETGIKSDDYETRMKSIQKYLRDTRKQLADMDKNNTSYSAMIKKLQKELTNKNSEITKLQNQVAMYQEENEGLISKVNLQSVEIEQKSQMIMIKEQELALIEAKMQELMIKAEVSEADAYFARGEAMELAASRTKLAPKKKKETYEEAIELYKKSQALGNTFAQAKIEALQKKI